MRSLSFFALGLMIAAAGIAGGCVGSDPASSSPPATGPDGSTPCTGAGCSDGGGPGPETDSGVPTDSGVDAAPPACTKIQVTTLAGSNAAGATNGASNVATFNAPEGITVDGSNGTIYVADTGNKLIRKVLADGTTSTFSTKAGTSGNWINPRRVVFAFSIFATDTNHDQVYSVVGDDATSYCGWANMRAVAVQTVGFGVYLTNGYQIAKCNAGNFTPVVFSGADPAGFGDGTGATAKYDTTVDLGFDGDATLIVADQGNHRLRKVKVTAGADNGDVVTLAGNGTAAHVDGMGTAAQFEGPNAIFVDATTHVVYVGDGPTIRAVTAAGAVTTIVGSGSAFVDGNGCDAKFVNIKGIAKFANELYVTDVNRIRKIVMN